MKARTSHEAAALYQQQRHAARQAASGARIGAAGAHSELKENSVQTMQCRSSRHRALEVEALHEFLVCGDPD